MKLHLLDILACPTCVAPLRLEKEVLTDGEVESGELVCEACGKRFPILHFIPRFVPAENYASNFGLQWNRFRQTQLDSRSGASVSRDRFFRQSGWTAAEMAESRVLDVGCGAGRFAEVSLGTGAEVVALDYSGAVDACWDNLGPHPRLNVVQGDIYQLPFRRGSFDYVYCFGVLQHTPDVHGAFLSLPEQVRPGGSLAVDVYPKDWKCVFMPKYYLRPVTVRLQPERLFALIQRGVPWLLPISRGVSRIPLLGRFLRHLIPVANYDGVITTLSSKQLREWAVLDTYDWFSPRYDHPQTARTLRRWCVEAKLEDAEVLRAGHLTGRGRRSAA